MGITHLKHRPLTRAVPKPTDKVSRGVGASATSTSASLTVTRGDSNRHSGRRVGPWSRSGGSLVTED
eukprot:3651384-Prymnesium_polylepis.1